MPAIHYPHVLPVIWEDVIFDRNSVGCTRRSEGEPALWVAMRPSVFLSIATPLPCPRPSLDWLRTHIEAGRAICPAELVFDADLRMPLALSHEGRHRMTALREKLRDRPVPVRLRLSRMQDCDIDDRLIARLRAGARSQRGRTMVDGPLFEDAEVDLGGRPASGVPPPDCRMPPNGVKWIQRHRGKRMSRLGEFLNRIKHDARIVAAIGAAGLFAALAPAQAVAAGPSWGAQGQKIVVDNIMDAQDLNERVSDQLGGMKALSDALNYSISYGSPNITGVQKARNLAMAFSFQMQQAEHPEHAQTDRYLVSPGGFSTSQQLRDMVEIVNAKKMELNEFALLIVEIEKSLAAGNPSDIAELSTRLAEMADEVQEKLYHDISVGYEDGGDHAATGAL